MSNRTLLIVAVAGCTNASAADPPKEPGWAPEMRELFENEGTCAYPQESVRWACNRFVPQAMKIVYGNTDFVDADGKYPLANDIAKGLEAKKWDDWTNLGEATSDEAVKKAQDAANAGQPAVAVWFDKSTKDPTGHVTLIIPGDLVQTGVKTKKTWKERKAPCTANWKKGSADSSFISKGLNFAFSDPKDVVLYARSKVMTVAPPPRTCVEIAKKKP